MKNTLKETLRWHQEAIPKPTTKTACVAVGCAYEETSELASTLGDMITHVELASVAEAYKGAEVGYMLEIEQLSEDDRVQMLDDIVDEIVTRVGIAHHMGFDILGALEEVNRSNFSKFEGGQAVFDANGKITKGKHYSKPDLKPYV